MDFFAAALLVAGLTAVWLIRRTKAPGSERADQDWLPVGLARAELAWSERAFRCELPVPMTVRIDRAYRTNDRQLMLVEFKRRAVVRTYQSDLVELSVQRYVMQQAGHSVSRLAYVVVVGAGDGRRTVLPLQLEDARSVEHRIARLSSLLDGVRSPGLAAHPALCSRCGHRDRCPSTKTRRNPSPRYSDVPLSRTRRR